MGLCLLHPDHRPSFMVDPNKNLFYCYGCGCGGDVIRLAELYHGIRFVGAWSERGSLLPDVAKFYQMQLHRHSEALAFLVQRGLHRAEVIEELRIGCAPGRCLRGWLTSLGYPLESLQQAGLVNVEGHDTFSHRLVFPLEGNLYGRSTGAATAHRFLPGSKGGLYASEKVRTCPEIILVEGMFDLAVLWQAGFRNVTCALGIRAALSQVTARQVQTNWSLAGPMPGDDCRITPVMPSTQIRVPKGLDKSLTLSRMVLAVGIDANLGRPSRERSLIPASSIGIRRISAARPSSKCTVAIILSRQTVSVKLSAMQRAFSSASVAPMSA
jgi:DNA primase